MLVLSRKVGEEILIDGGRIRIMLVDVRNSRKCGKYGKIGIEAPRDVAVHRAEVARRIAGVADADDD